MNKTAIEDTTQQYLDTLQDTSELCKGLQDISEITAGLQDIEEVTSILQAKHKQPIRESADETRKR